MDSITFAGHAILKRKTHFSLRFQQTDIGPIVSKTNEPPRYVMLDDRAVYEVLRSDIPRTRTVVNWPHDFGGPGKIRARRVHRGRPAIRDAQAEGEERFHSMEIGSINNRYYLHGEKNYTPIIFSLPQPSTEDSEVQRKREAPYSEEDEGDDEYNPRKHGHNQFTPKDLLVKYGAPSFSRVQKHRGDRINDFLRKQPLLSSERSWRLRAGNPGSAWLSFGGFADRKRGESGEGQDHDDLGMTRPEADIREVDEESTLFISEDSEEPEEVQDTDQRQRSTVFTLATAALTSTVSLGDLKSSNQPGEAHPQNHYTLAAELEQSQEQIRIQEQEIKHLSQSLERAREELKLWKQRVKVGKTMEQ